MSTPLPDPVAFRWDMNSGFFEYHDARFNEDALDPPCDPEDWSVCAALFDADQMRAYGEACVAAAMKRHGGAS